MFATAILLGFLLPLIIDVIRTRYKKNLSSIPGPFLASFSNLWKINAVFHGDMPSRNIALHERYGPVVRIGPNHVSFASPEALKTIYTARPTFPKSNFYKPTGPLYRGKRLDNLFSVQDVDYHTRLKKNILSLYTKAVVLDLEPRIDDTIKLFVQVLDKHTTEGPTNLDMSFWLHLFAFDSLGDINLSKRFGFLDTGKDVRDMLETADRILHMTGLYGQSPFLQDVQMRIKARWTKTRPNPLLLYAVSEVHKRLEKPTMKQDMLSRFIELRESDPSKVSIDEIAGAIYINLMAGHDVLAITLRAILYYLSNDARIMAALKKELETLDKQPSKTKSDTIPCAKLNTLPYLDAVIHEALRIHTNTGLILERVIPAGGAIIDGYFLPEATIVGVNGWVLHRNTEIFDEDVDTFRPERWLEVSERKQAEMKRYIFSFGDGSRKCIGQNIAMAQVSKVVVELLRRFDFALVDKEQWHVHGSWVTKQTNMIMKVSKREI